MSRAVGATISAPTLSPSAARGAYTTVVFHNATAGTARPAGAAHVIWIGTVTPTNPITDDEFIDKSTSPATFKRYTGSAFEAIGGGGGGSGVSSFNTRTGAVTLAKTDVTGTGLAASDVSAAPAQESVNVVTTAGAAQTLPDPVTAQSMNRLTLTATCALTFPSLGAGKSFTLSLIQDATGARTVTWPGTVLWPNNTPPILTTTPGKRDTFVFWSETGSNWSGATVGLSY